ncbi:GDSL esterase/lipase At2g03980 [Cajanus cajan]|uniref:GDSL esterase/lipase At2g03980 family n=1 Tax=Cajanus cajan TaxID=3821 RepID=A0A151TEH0_CAJCA|nr:GDSL esterase/lipase At2g03980 [Cajanus cajan]KYP65451.1 GDSL esterase/lipase At2g03980 family [Cajanus cajan]
MASFKILCVISILTHQLAFLANGMHCRKSLVPALYVFGDSSLDAGNNNNLNTPAKANVFPYGIDFNNCSTGRFNNGKTFADIIAISLGLPMPPPYLGVSEIERYQVATGINYASASCGILNSTGDGSCLSLDKQIEYFTSTVKNDLPRIIQSTTKLRHYLSKSIYLLSIGPNDYMLNYLKNNPMEPNNNLNPEQYANYLIEELASRIKRIYDLGARKFVINSIGPVGCIPAIVIRTPHSEYCNEEINQKVKPYSEKLPGKLHDLQTQLSGSLFINLDSYNFFMKIRNSPQIFGFSNVWDSCIQGAKPCENRKEYYFYDSAHSTEAATKIFAEECFSGTRLCFPYNIKRLVHAH